METEKMTIEPGGGYFTTREAADFLRVSTKRLLNMVSAGQIPYCKLGKSNRYKRSELEKLLTKNKRGPIYD